MAKKIIAFLFLMVVLGSAFFYIARREKAAFSQSNPSSLKEASYYHPAANGRVRCDLCPNLCSIADQRFGACKARKNIGGKLYAMNFGQVAAFHVDPIEKKPFFHFLP